MLILALAAAGVSSGWPLSPHEWGFNMQVSQIHLALWTSQGIYALANCNSPAFTIPGLNGRVFQGQRCKSMDHARRFLSPFGLIYEHFNLNDT